MLRIGTSIVRDKIPGYPAFEKIFQKGAIRKNAVRTMIISSGRPIERSIEFFRATKLPHPLG
jgi:hypothetical protein